MVASFLPRASSPLAASIRPANACQEQHTHPTQANTCKNALPQLHVGNGVHPIRFTIRNTDSLSSTKLPGHNMTKVACPAMDSQFATFSVEYVPEMQLFTAPNGENYHIFTARWRKPPAPPAVRLRDAKPAYSVPPVPYCGSPEPKSAHGSGANARSVQRCVRRWTRPDRR